MWFWIKSVHFFVLWSRIKTTVFTVFSVNLLESNATDVENMAVFIISDSKSTRNNVLFFVFNYANFDFNGHFRHFGRPFWIEDINWKSWVAIPYNVIRWRTLYVKLKNMPTKMKTSECRIRNHENNRYDVT